MNTQYEAGKKANAAYYAAQSQLNAAVAAFEAAHPALVWGTADYNTAIYQDPAWCAAADAVETASAALAGNSKP
jgi:hypothetical protein